MSRIKFLIDSNNTIKIISSDYEEDHQYISAISNGDEKIITISITESEELTESDINIE